MRRACRCPTTPARGSFRSASSSPSRIRSR
nr:MAG TPA: hypothetical protein [Caudoviricetes sp.]